ncbi:DUF4082 domain-containing protein [Microbacterium ureisolvens]|uniref:DUF4082 domain-containing protein n=1 Tax=Microbacterium ureisolvens TaxID=2781186 RepID=UPI003642BFAF
MSRFNAAPPRPLRRALAVLLALVLSVTGVTLAAPAVAATTEATFFGTEKPAITAFDDSGAVELGLTIVPAVSGTVSGIRFYKGVGNTGTHTGSLWSASGQRLATTTFTDETASGWQVARFSTPVAVTKGTRYVASYHAPRGHYAAATSAFTSAVTRGDLTAPANAGVYAYGASRFPSSSYRASNYYVDVLFSPAAAPSDTVAPVISAVSASGVTQTSATIAWTTNEAASTQINFGTTSAYGKTTTLDSTMATAHRQTISGLAAGVTYHYQVRSVDAAGNVTVSRVDRTFTTSTTTTPAPPATPSPPAGFQPGNASGAVPVPAGMGAEDASRPTAVVGTGTAASCTSAAVVAAVATGGVVTFNCGSSPVTIPLSQTLKIRNSTENLVIDGGGLVTLSGGGVRRILYIDTCDSSLGSVPGNCLYAPAYPRVTVQNITLADGNATNESYVSPGDVNQGSNGGGAIFALGGRLKVVNTIFTGNTCAPNGPDLGGGAVRVLAQHSATPNSLDPSQAAMNQDPVVIVNSTFGGAGKGNSCSNGGAISGLRTPITIVNSLLTDNSAVGCCANPAKPGTPGGGSGGAIYTDGGTYDVRISGSRIERNSAKAGGSAIFYVSNSRTGRLYIDQTTSSGNTYAASGQPTPQSFENYPGIFYLGSGNPSFTNSTIK